MSTPIIIAGNALWFSRHVPTVEQLAEIQRRGFNLVQPDQKDLGGAEINCNEDLDQVIQKVADLCKKHDIQAIFGVFPTPVLAWFRCHAEMQNRAGKPMSNNLYASWNTSRSVEGGKPTFVHHKWMVVGRFLFD
jgi:hypothetical protein